MRTWMVVLLILSCIDFNVTFSNGVKVGFSFFLRLLALILFCINY